MLCDQRAPELIRDRFIVGINDRTLTMKLINSAVKQPQNGSQWPFIFFVYFFYIMAGGILDNRKSRLITFLAISDQYATFLKIILIRNWLFWMTKNHLQSHFSPFQINT